MMRGRPLRWLRFAAASLVFSLAVLATPVRAQDERPFQEPGISFMDPEKPYIQWLAGVLIVIACLLIAAKNPHRSHQD